MKTDQRIKDGVKRYLEHHDLFYLYLRTFRCALTMGLGEARRRYREYINVNHPHSYRGHILTPAQRKKQRGTFFSPNAVISIITPLYNTPPRYLRAMLRSVSDQTYENWELCLADGSDEGNESVSRICRRAAKRDPRIKYQRLKRNLGISGNSNICLQMTTGDFIGLLDHDDLLHPSALYEIMLAIDGKQADFVYTDEAVFKKTPKDVNRFHYKPDYSPDLLRGVNYICHFTVFRRKLMDLAGGGFRTEYDGSQDYDLFLRLTERAKKIVHVPKELYYWRDHVGSVASDVSVKPYTMTAAKRAIGDHLERVKLIGTVLDADCPSAYRIQYQISENPKISIIIPSMDHTEDLRTCIDSIRNRSTWKNWEIIIVENNSREKETFRYYEEIQDLDPRICVEKWTGDFNFSGICNFGASRATGDYLLLLNNDTEVITPSWLEEMLMYAQRKDVGAVGCMLYYPDDTIQHAGVIVGLGSAADHSYRGFRRGETGSLSRLKVVQNLSAVTGACMMIPRKIYKEMNGMDESFLVAMNDVDLCLRIRQKGYLIVFTPFAELYHFESKSRGSDETGRNRERYQEESTRFRERWQEVYLKGDPYYNPNLTRRRTDFSIREEDEV